MRRTRTIQRTGNRTSGPACSCAHPARPQGRIPKGGGTCPSWARGIRGVFLQANGEPQPLVKVALQIEGFIRPLLAIVYGGTAALLTPYSIIVDLLQTCDFGETGKRRCREAVPLFAFQAALLTILTPLSIVAGPAAPAAFGAAAAFALAMTNVCDALGKGKAPSVANLLNIAGPMASLASATGQVSPQTASSITTLANSAPARAAARTIDTQTGATTVGSKTDPLDAAAAAAVQSALLAAGLAAVRARRDAWPAFEQRFAQIQGLARAGRGAQDVINDLSSLLPKAGGKQALLMAKYAKAFAQARATPSKMTPVLNEQAVAQWVQNPSNFLRGVAGNLPAPSTSTTKSNVPLLLAAGAALLLLTKR